MFKFTLTLNKCYVQNFLMNLICNVESMIKLSVFDDDFFP